jgi:WD40 repeat protein
MKFDNTGNNSMRIFLTIVLLSLVACSDRDQQKSDPKPSVVNTPNVVSSVMATSSIIAASEVSAVSEVIAASGVAFSTGSNATNMLTVVPSVEKITDEKRYAGIISGKSIVVKELATGKVLLEEKLTYNILYFAISSDGEWLAVSGQGGGQLMNIPTKKVIVSLPSYATVMEFSPDGTRLAVNSSGASVLDCKTGRIIGQFQMSDFRNGLVFTSFTFSPDGKKIFAVVQKGDIYRLNADTFQPLGDAWLGMGAYQIAFSPDSRRLAVARQLDDSAQVVMLDAETGTLLNNPASAHIDDRVQAMTFTPNGRYVLTAGSRGSVTLWDGATGKSCGQTFVSKPFEENLSFSQDVNRLYALGSGQSWDISIATVAPQQTQGAPKATVQVALPTGINSRNITAETHFGPESAVFKSDSGLLVIGTMWRLLFVNGEETRTSTDIVIKQEPGEGAGPTAIVSVAISRNGRRATAAPDYAAMFVYDVATGNQVSIVSDSVEFADEYGRPHTFMPDGTLAIPWKHGIRIVNAEKGNTLRRIKYKFDGNIAVVAAGTAKPWLAVGTSNGSLLLARTDTSNAPVVMQQIHKGAVTTAVFSPDDSVVATGGADGSIRLFEAATGKPASAVWAAHADAVTSINFSSDGKYLVSGSADGTVRVWNVSTGQPITDSLAGHSERVLAVMFDASSGQVLSFGHDGILRRWTILTK